MSPVHRGGDGFSVGRAVFWLVPLGTLSSSSLQILPTADSIPGHSSALGTLDKLPKYMGSFRLLSPSEGGVENFPKFVCVFAGPLFSV